MNAVIPSRSAGIVPGVLGMLGFSGTLVATRVGQINLLLPLAALGWSVLFLGEEITTAAIVCAMIVLGAMIVCQKSRP